MTYSLDNILAILKKKGYPIQEEDTKPYNLNLVGIRAHPGVPNTFDDTMAVLWKFSGYWFLRSFPMTTDPGKYWLNNPINVEGTAIIKEGYYSNVWEMGLHRGEYLALKQVGNMTYFRDNDKDSLPEIDGMKEYTGIIGANCHRANANGQSIQIDKWSAACQVLQNKQINNPDNQMVRVFEFDYFIHLCKQQVDIAQRNKFNYALINQKDFLSLPAKPTTRPGA